jgi:hypothetical protein
MVTKKVEAKKLKIKKDYSSMPLEAGTPNDDVKMENVTLSKERLEPEK